MPRQRHNLSSTMNNQDHKGTQKERKKTPENKLKDVQICDLNKKEFKITVLKKLNETQENTERQLNKLRNKLTKRKLHQRD